MSKQQKTDNPGSLGAVRKGKAGLFEPGGKKGPIDDLNEYEAVINGVADPERREFLQEASRFATTLEYISTVGIPLPLQIASQVEDLKDQSLSVRERVSRMRRVNQQLMEFIDKHDRKSSPVRQ